MSKRVEPADRHHDPEFPHIPYEIFRPEKGSPYYACPISGLKVCLSKPGTLPLTSEIVRKELEDLSVIFLLFGCVGLAVKLTRAR